MANSEKIGFNPETHSNEPETLRNAGEKQRDVLRERLEQIDESKHENNVEKIQHEAFEQAKSKEQEKADLEPKEESPAERRRGPITKKEREISYKATMQEIQTHMSAPSRAFSKAIHNKAVEQTSEVVGSTIARPNAILSGAIAAFALTLGVYLLAKNLGYPLSGFESIGAFVLGWIIGLLYDFIKAMITGRR